MFAIGTLADDSFGECVMVKVSVAHGYLHHQESRCVAYLIETLKDILL